MSTHTQNTNGTYPGPTPFGTAPGITWTPGNPAFGPQGGPVANPAAWGFHPFANPAYYPTPTFGFQGFHPGYNTPTPAFVNPWAFQTSPNYGYNAWNPWGGTPSNAWWNTPAAFAAPAPFGWNTPTNLPFGFGHPAVGYAGPFPFYASAPTPFGAPPAAWNPTPWWNAGPVGARPTNPIPGYAAERTVAGPCCATREAA